MGLLTRITWRRRIWACVASLVAAFLQGATACAAAPPSLDLGAFAPGGAGAATADECDAIVPADDNAPLALLPPTTDCAQEMSAPPARRFYLTSIVGGSFLIVTADNTPTSSLTAGGAIGVSMKRSNGRIRLEAEGRYRDFVEQTYLGFNENYSAADPTAVGTVQASGSAVRPSHRACSCSATSR